MLPGMAGANLLYGLGMQDSGLTFDLGQLLMDAEMAEMILFALGGIVVNDETLSVDLIKEIGYKKDYLTHRNTFNNRFIQSKPRLINRQLRSHWEAQGSTTIGQRAEIAARKIIEEYQPMPMPDKAKQAIRKIVNAREKETGVEISTD